MPDAITVVLIDDHPAVRAGIRSLLSVQDDIEVIGDAGTASDGVSLCVELRPRVVLVDLMLPGTDGVVVIERVSRAVPDTRIAVLTSYTDDHYLFPALRAGALSYLLKDAGPEQLADAVRATAAGETVLHPRMAARVVQHLRTGSLDDPNAFHELSARELQVLRLIGGGLSNRDIAGRLVIGEATVKTHVRSILAKLNVADRTQAAVLAWRSGVVRPD